MNQSQNTLMKLSLKPMILSIHMILAAGVAITTQSAIANTAPAIEYNVAAGTLTQALNQFALQSGVKVSVDSQKLAGLHSSGLQGKYSVSEGFAELLKNSPYQIQKIDDGYTIVEKIKIPPTQARDMGQLKPIDVNVSGQENRSANAVNQLPVITVNAEKNGSAEDGYLVKNITGVGIWNERSLQDTPYSMSVVSSDLIENSLAQDMTQIFKMNPLTQETGIADTNDGDAITPTIRGFSTRNSIVNGISYAGSGTSSPMMLDIERAEIISGATGFLYGGGRVGGAVNYVTKKPTIENLRTVTLGSYGGESVFGHIDLGGQFDQGHVFGYRVNAMYQTGELASSVDKDQKLISLIFDYKPTENFYTDLKYFYKDSLEKGGNTWFTPKTDRKSLRENKSYTPDWIEAEVKSNKIENSINWKINDIFTLRTNIFYEKMKHRNDGSSITYQNNTVIGDPTWSSFFSKSAWMETENYGANVYFDSKFNIGEVNHNLTIGYSSNSYQRSRHSDKFVFYDPAKNMTLNEFKSLSEPDWSSFGTLGTSTLTPDTKTEYKNILIGDDIQFNQNWSALVGANYASTISKSFSSTPSYDSSKLTPTLSLIYKPFDALTTYTTYIESLQAGSIVSSYYQNEGDILEPYVSKQYEIGAKYNLNDRSLITAALFRLEKANSYEIPTTPKTTLAQDGEQIHQGIELGITGKLTNNLTVVAGGTLMNLNIDKATNAALEGKKPTYAATKMAKIYAEYNIPTIEGLTLTGGVYYTGDQYTDSANTDKLDAYTLFDAGIRYSTKLGKYPTKFNLNASNLTNKVYWTNSYLLGEPRTVAFSVKTQF